MFHKPEVCILPVAGLCSRNLPATKVLHKGFLTLNSLPIIQYAVECCKEIGVKEIIFIYSDQSAMALFKKYFSKSAKLERYLKKSGKTALLEALEKTVPEGMKFSFAKQSAPLGNGHAILMAKEIVGQRDFIVMWPDDVYINFNGEGILKELCDIYEHEGGIVENIMEFPKEEMVRYGALVGAAKQGRIVRATGLVEKPKFNDVPSNFASMGPYILPNIIMDILPEVKKSGTNGEINLTDAINLATRRGEKLTGVLGSSQRFDCGTNKELEKSNLKLMLMNNPDLRAYARELLETLH